MSFFSSLDISKNALSAQRLRMDIISQNIANAETTRTEDGGPYIRQYVSFEERTSFKKMLGDENAKLQYEGVTVDSVKKDDAPLVPVYDPTHPDAGEDGYVMMPNVDKTIEMIDFMAATRAYDANVTILNGVKAMASKALQIGK